MGGKAPCRLTVPARWRYPPGQGQGSPEGCIHSESAFSVRYCFSHSQDSRCRHQGLEMVVTLLSITPSDPQAKALLPVSAALCSAGLEVLAPEGGGFHKETQP